MEPTDLRAAIEIAFGVAPRNHSIVPCSATI
jgi:hypothetical protein